MGRLTAVAVPIAGKAGANDSVVRSARVDRGSAFNVVDFGADIGNCLGGTGASNTVTVVGRARAVDGAA